MRWKRLQYRRVGVVRMEMPEDAVGRVGERIADGSRWHLSRQIHIGHCDWVAHLYAGADVLCWVASRELGVRKGSVRAEVEKEGRRQKDWRRRADAG